MGSIYYQVIDVTDFGPYVTKLVLAMPREVSQGEVSCDAFNVYVEIRDKEGKIVQVPVSFLQRDEFRPSAGYRPVTKVYPSTREGEPLGDPEGKSPYVALEMPYGPIWKCSSSLSADFRDPNGHEFYTVNVYRVTQLREIGEGKDVIRGLVFDSCAGIFNPKKDRFRTSVSSYEALPLRYGYFVPQRRGGRKPLVIFLHGAGEGGQDTAIAWSGNKVTAFTEDPVQDLFGGAYVLVPQCDTMWLDDGSHVYGTTGKSMYTEALKALIDEFLDLNEEIDRDRIYLGGDSNGGFMTMRMLMSYPDFFAAAFPICEAMIDSAITDEDIGHLKDIPIWFTHAKNDPLVKPEDYVVPTYKRLMAAGAENVHFTFWDRITDIHEGFKDEQGNPYEYLGHFAWIPVFNDDCRVDYDGKPVLTDGRETGILEWLAAQRRTGKQS